MEALQARIDSFAKPKRVRNPSKSSSYVSIKWPHPQSFLANPDTLVEAGFFFNPSFEDRDNCTCYICGKHIGDWEVKDDPFDIHYEKCGTTCPWAIVRCGLRVDMDDYGQFVFPNASRVPNSKLMEKARQETFYAGGGWIHDQTKNHGANSKKMARAGFIFTPQYIGDDLASCLYCNISLSGWDAEDDPIEEHRKREKKLPKPCPFLTFSDPSNDVPKTKPPSRINGKAGSSKPSSRSTSKSKHQDLILPMKTHDGDSDENISDSAASTAPPSSKTPRKGRSTSSSARVAGAKTPKAGSRSGSRNTARNVESELGPEDEEIPQTEKKKGTIRARSKSISRNVTADQEEQDEIVEPPPTTKKKPARARSKSVTRSIATDVEDEEVAEPPRTVKKKPGARSKSVARSIATDAEEEEVAEPPLTAKKNPRARSKSVARSAVTDHENEEATEPPTIKKKPGRPKSKSVARKEQVDEDETINAGSPKTNAGRLKSVARSVANEQTEDDGEQPSRKPARGKTKQKAVEESESEVEVVLRQSSRSRTRTTTAATATEEVAEEVASRKQPRIKSKARTIVESETEETEQSALEDKARSIIEKPKPRASSRTKVKPPSSSRHAQQESETELESEPVTAVTPAPKKKKANVAVAPKAPTPSPQLPGSVADNVDGDDDEEEEEIGGYLPPQLSPSPLAVVHPPEEKELSQLFVPKRGPKPNFVQADATAKFDPIPEKSKSQKASPPISVHAPTQMKEEGRKHIRTAVIEQEEKDDVFQDAGHHREKDSSVATAPLVESEKQREREEHPPTQNSQPVLEIQHSPSLEPVGMAPPNPFAQGPQEIAAPSTPPRAVMHPPSASPNLSEQPALLTSAAEDTNEPLIIPPLSKLPFTPLHMLSDAELDMTVEEWIRYQMEVEHDKFRRDGERELVRFRKRAEEVRKVIEGL